MVRAVKILIITQLVLFVSYFYSFEVFINIEIGFLSSLFVILGSSFAYKKMVKTKIESDMIDEKRDLLDEIEDPYELYDDEPINEASEDELDLKQIVKEERAKIKTFSVDSIKHGARGSVSMFRIIPYIFLILGFIALKNNNLLDISIYLPSLLIGIVIGSIISKDSLS